MRFFRLVSVLCCLTLSASHGAQAWDESGHRIIARIADYYLLPDVRRQVNEILSGDTDALTPHDFAGAATWAGKYMKSDEFTSRARFDGTRNWHFVKIYPGRPDIPEACFSQQHLPVATPASQGPADACIIDKIDQFKAELSDAKTSSAERLLALKYILHLVGDIHQPLHVQDQYNDFGRLTPVSAEDKSITPGTLFGYWDHALVQRQGLDEGAVVNRLIAAIAPEDRELWSGQVTHIWALESLAIGHTYANGTMLGNFSRNSASYVVSVKELDRAKDIVGRQLSKAGFRLAHLLNVALTPNTGSPGAKIPQTPSSARIRAGLKLAESKCQVCHVVKQDAWKEQRSTIAPDFVTVANIRDMSPVVLREFLPGPHPIMPNMALTTREIEDVITFIMSLRTRP